MENTDVPIMSRIERLKLQAFKNFMEKKELSEQEKLNVKIKIGER
jgi:hypothetical protein